MPPLFIDGGHQSSQTHNDSFKSRALPLVGLLLTKGKCDKHQHCKSLVLHLHKQANNEHTPIP